MEKVHNYVLLNYGKDLSIGDKLTGNEQWECFNWVKSEYDTNKISLEELFKLSIFVYDLDTNSSIADGVRLMGEMDLVEEINPELYSKLINELYPDV